MPLDTLPTLYLPFGFDADYTAKGWFPSSAAQFSSGMYIPLTFVDQSYVAEANSCGWTEVNMIVIEQVTVPHMEKAVASLDYKDWVCCCYAFTQAEVEDCVRRKNWPPRPPSRNGWPPESDLAKFSGKAPYS